MAVAEAEVAALALSQVRGANQMKLILYIIASFLLLGLSLMVWIPLIVIALQWWGVK